MLIAVVALLFRLHALTLHPLWLDEIWTVMLSAGHGTGFKDIPVGVLLSHGPDLTGIGEVPLWRIALHLKSDVHPPLVYLLLRLWISVGGGSDGWVRGFPVFFSVLALVCAYFPARRTVGPAAALGAVALMAVARFDIYNAQEVRSYALLQFVMVLAVWAALLIVQDGATRRRLCAWAAASLALMLTHYFALGAVAALGLWLLLAAGKCHRQGILVSGGAVAVIFGLVWGPFFVEQLRGGGLTGTHMSAVAGTSIFRSLQLLAALPARNFLPPAPLAAGWPQLFGLGLLVSMPVIAWRSGSRALLAWWACLAGSLAMQLALDLGKGLVTLEFPRYSFHTAPAVYVGIAALMMPWTRRPAVRLAPVGVAIVLALFTVWHWGYPPKAPWRSVAHDFDLFATDTYTLVILGNHPDDWRPGANYMCLSYYSTQARKLPLLLADDNHPLSSVLLAQLHGNSRILLVARDRQPPPIAGYACIRDLGWPPYTADAANCLYIYEPAAPAATVGERR